MNINENFRYLNTGLPDDILRRKLHGDFEGAIRLIDRRLLDKSTPAALRGCLLVQKEICQIMPTEYPYTATEALNLLKEYIPDFTEDEFNDWIDEGKLSWIYINGEMHFFNRFFQTLCKTDAVFISRVTKPLPADDNPEKGKQRKQQLKDCIRLMKEKGKSSKRIRIHASLKMKDGQFTPGMFVRVHLPVPAACEQQSDIVIEKVFPANGQVSPENDLQRTVCWEENMKENHEFYVEYSYIHTAVYHHAEIHEERNASDFITEEELLAFIQEESPHIVFTPYIRALVNDLTEGISDPLEKARKFYDFITLNMRYNFVPPYFILENIPESCARNFTGDCGVFALLFITLCRCAGIPACWQSGLAAQLETCGPHDWARFYTEAKGWLYVDASFGVSAARDNDEERRNFYFGNLDSHRMVANNAFQKPFSIDKDHWRADPYDNQVGEIETADKGLKSGEFETVQEVLLCEEI